MTPEAHSTAIKEAAQRLNELVEAARNDGLVVVDFEAPRLVYRPLLLDVWRRV